MKKIAIQFAAYFLVVACLFLLAGRTDGWIEPPEEGPSADIVLSGTKYNGKVVVNITLHPDGTMEHEGNGTVTEGTWEKGEGDVAMIAHYPVKDTNYDMEIIDTGSGYKAMYPLVADMELTGKKPVQSIILSGTKYNGKVVVKITLNPDGTGEHEGNGEAVPATWEKGEGDVAMVVHFNVKGTDYDMNVVDAGNMYTADYPLVAEMPLTGSKEGGAAEAPAEVPAETEAATEAPTEAATEAATEAPAQAPAAEEGPEYPDNTFVLPFTADVNEQLKTTFSCEASVWEPALGTTGSYTPSESEDILFSWTGSGKSSQMDFFANGTYEYRFTTMSITEKGTWSYEGGNLSITSEKGTVQPAELVKAEPAPAAEPAKAAEEGPEYPDNTFVLPFTADINEQLKTTFSCEASVWEPALGTTGSYTPSESENTLFSWTGSGKSSQMDFFANGTYEYRFTTMSITEKGTWSYEGGNLSITSEKGTVQPAELVKAEPAPAAEPAKAAEEGPEYPDNTFVLPFTADINEQLKTTFSCEASVWEPALGTTGSYTPSESEEILFSWTGSGKSSQMDFFSNGTYEYRFTTMSITEKGTWSYEVGKLSITSEKGTVQEAELVKAAGSTLKLEFVADINEQLTGHFSCEADVWQAALGTTGSYAPTDSEEVLIAWTSAGKSTQMDFFANGTYEFRFTSMNVAEHGTWTYENGELTATSAAGKVMTAVVE